MKQTESTLSNRLMLLLSVFLLGVVFESAGADQPDPTLGRLREAYEEEAARLSADADAQRARLNTQYGAALEALYKSLQARGDLEPLLAVREEHNRFGESGTISELNCVDEPEDLGKLQRRCLEARDRIEQSSATAVVELAARYDRSLASFQETLTRDGRLDDALAVKSERESLRKREEVAAAEFALAELAARKPKAPGPVAPPTVRAPVQPAEPTRKYTGNTRTHLAKRYEALTEFLLQRNWRACMDYIDPDAVKRLGTDAVTARLRMVMPVFRAAENRNIKIKAGDIIVSEEDGEATLTPKGWWGNNWHDLGPTYWSLIEGDWYMRIDGAPAAGEGGDRQPPPRPSRRRGRRDG